MPEYNWMSKYGVFKQKDNSIIFEGGVNEIPSTRNKFAKMGLYLSDQKFGEGSIEAKINFQKISKEFPQACAIVLSYINEVDSFIAAGFNMFPKVAAPFAVFSFDNTATTNKWNIISQTGDINNILPKND